MSYMNLIILTQYKSEQKNPLYGCVVGIVCFAKILIYDAFSALTQRIKITKNFTKQKKCYC